MWANLVLVATNAPCIWTAARAYQRRQTVAAASVLAAGLASALYHGAESHKHQHVTPGLGYARSKEAQFWLLQLDRACAFLAFIAVASSSPTWIDYAPKGLMLLVCVSISEMLAPQFESPALHLYLHVVFHSLWHMGVFLLSDRVLSVS